MSRFRRVEDEADKWLRENDSYYSSTDIHKKKRIRYPYDTPEQEKRRREVEIPFSSLSLRQRSEIPEAIKIFD